jgi:hypothetical protein
MAQDLFVDVRRPDGSSYTLRIPGVFTPRHPDLLGKLMRACADHFALDPTRELGGPKLPPELK